MQCLGLVIHLILHMVKLPSLGTLIDSSLLLGIPSPPGVMDNPKVCAVLALVRTPETETLRSPLLGSRRYSVPVPLEKWISDLIALGTLSLGANIE